MSFCIHCGKELGEDCLFCPECGNKTEQNEDEFCLDKTNMKKCSYCGTYMPNDMFYCLNCGHQFPVEKNYNETDLKNAMVQEQGAWKNKWVAFFLCLFFGWFGVHKFYEDKTVMGIIYLVTGGLFCIGWLVDLITLWKKPVRYRVG